MKKSVLIIDWLLVITFILIAISKFTNSPFINIVQPVFFILIIIHIIQHWRVLIYSLKGLRKSNLKIKP